MKRLVKNYQFIPEERKVVFTDYASIDLEGVLLITNVTRGVIIYNFADASLGGMVQGNALILYYDTTGMSSSDELQIWYDDGKVEAITPEYDRLDIEYEGDSVKKIYYKKGEEVVQTITFEYEGGKIIKVIKT